MWVNIIIMMLIFNLSMTVANQIWTDSWGQTSSVLQDPNVRFGAVSTAGLVEETETVFGYILRVPQMIVDFFKFIWQFISMGNQVRDVIKIVFPHAPMPSSIITLMNVFSRFLYTFVIIGIIGGDRFNLS